MKQDEYKFILEDRIAKIQAIQEQFNILENSYIAFSGGKDSTILHYLIDIALPNNKIPRIYANTGIEHKEIVQYIKNLQKNDKRIIILNQKRNIIRTLKEYGYPFKSKEHSLKIEQFNKGSKGKFIKKYINRENTKTNRFNCPKILLYQFKEKNKYNYSNKCCYKLKKELSDKWKKENNKTITLTGMRREEGGQRINLNCITNKGTKINFLVTINEEFENEFIKQEKIKLCKLYYEPYNFKRTGCIGCPYNQNLQEDLNTLYKLLPKTYKQCLHIWEPIYNEYIRIGYRLKYYPHEKGVQMNIFDYMEEK